MERKRPVTLKSLAEVKKLKKLERVVKRKKQSHEESETDEEVELGVIEADEAGVPLRDEFKDSNGQSDGVLASGIQPKRFCVGISKKWGWNIRCLSSSLQVDGVSTTFKWCILKP